MVGFIFNANDKNETPQSVARKRAIMAQILGQTAQPRPARNVGEGLGNAFSSISNGLVANIMNRRADAAEQAGMSRAKTLQDRIFESLTGAPRSSLPTPEVSGEMALSAPGGMNGYRDAIAGIESAGSGDYNAIGPTNAKLGRALGRYQIMESNIGPWSQEALGRAVTAEEFMKNPHIQDAIFDHRFGSYVNKYGPEGAAQAWFAGPGGVGKTGRRDVLGTTVGDYGKRFMNAVGGAPQAIEAQAPGSGYVDPMVSAPNYNPAASGAPQISQQQFDERFGGQPQGAQTAMAPPLPAGREVGPAPGMNMPQPQMQPQQPDQPPQNVPATFGGMDMKQFAELISDPWVSDSTREMALMLLQHQMKQNDPAYRMQLERGQAELDALRNPQPKSTDDIREYEFAKSQGFGGTFADWQMENRRAGATNVTTNVGEGDKFYENLDRKNAETFSAMSDSGIQARSKLGQIDRLEGLMANAPQGAMGAMKQAAGEWGIPTDGLSDIQAASALLEKMVPEQRAPGSGPMSDADIKMFRASLPRILNQPGGNQLIFDTMRGIAQYEMQMGEIADQVADRAITPADGRRLIRELKNPLDGFKIPEGSTPNEGWRELSPGVKIKRLD